MLSKDNDWNIDTSAGVPILVYKNCSVIESEQAEYILQLINNEVEIATELLSLREQLAALKALEPFAWGLADKDGNVYLNECCIGDEGCMIDEADGYNYELEPEHHIHAVQLFTAAKPAED